MSVKNTFVLLHRADIMFFMYPLKGLCVCVSSTWPLTGLGSLLMKRTAGNRRGPACGTLPFDWLAEAVLPLQAGRVILDL